MAKAKRGSDIYTVRINDELKEEMLSACLTLNMRPSSLIREALKKYLDDLTEEKIRSRKEI